MAEPRRLPDVLPDAVRTADQREVARRVVAEDGPKDVTSELVGASGPTAGTIRAREDAVVACLGYATEVARICQCEVAWHLGDGDRVARDGIVGVVRGDLGAVLRAERPMLNLLQRAAGIATATRRYVEAVRGTSCRILHTRKTTPGLRLFEVSAVVAGGGGVHRLGLDRIVMVKDNHWAGMRAGGRSLSDVCRDAHAHGVAAVHIEVEDEIQVEAACHAGADRLLVDNTAPQVFQRLAEFARELAPGIEVEATGGITLENVAAYAGAGADFISTGALTHSVRAIDLSLEIEDAD